MMADHYKNLPGECFVNHLDISPKGIHLNANLLDTFGFTSQQTATMLVSKGHIIITADPQKGNAITAIEELQIRQDETQQDFSSAIAFFVAQIIN